jgi:flagellar assembly protein FliH
MTVRVVRNPPLGQERRALGGSASPAISPSSIAPQAFALPTAPVPATPSTEAVRESDVGFDEGLRRGLDEANERIEKELETRWNTHKQQFEQAERRRSDEHTARLAGLDAMLKTIQKALPDRFMALERQAVELAYEALCKVCGPQPEQAAGSDRAGLLVDLVRQGIGQLRGHALVGVRLGTADHTAFMQSEASRALLDRYPELRVSVDPSLEPLGCIVESDHGQLDVGLATQLARLREVWAQETLGSPEEGRS